MRYVRPINLNHSLSLDGQPIDKLALVAERKALVAKFNSSVGEPGAVVAAMQADFVEGRMPYDEMVSYVRFCEYIIDAVAKRQQGGKA